MDERERNNNNSPKDDRLFKTGALFCLGTVVTHYLALNDPQTSLNFSPLVRNLIGGGVFTLAFAGTDKLINEAKKKIEQRKQKNKNL